MREVAGREESGGGRTRAEIGLGFDPGRGFCLVAIAGKKERDVDAVVFLAGLWTSCATSPTSHLPIQPGEKCKKIYRIERLG